MVADADEVNGRLVTTRTRSTPVAHSLAMVQWKQSLFGRAVRDGGWKTKVLLRAIGN